MSPVFKVTMKSASGVNYCASLLAACVIIATGLDRWGDSEIRNNLGEIVFLTAIGLVWTFVSTLLASLLGISLHLDMLDARNGSATVVICSVALASALIYTGGSIGDGASYWQNAFSAGLAGIGLWAIWIGLEYATSISRAITEDRDFASGVRLGGLLLACGLILARTVAGNWVSETDTIHDFFHDGWPAAALALADAAIEKFIQPTVARPQRSTFQCGVVPAILFVGAAALWIYRLGPWEGMPR